MLRVFFAVLSLVSVSFSAPLDCQKLIQHLDGFDHLQHASGRWALVAGSVKDSNGFLLQLQTTKSISLELGESSFTQFIKSGHECWTFFSNFTLEGRFMKAVVDDSNHTVTFWQTSCSDCRLLTVEVRSSASNSEGIYLRRRQLEEKEMEEFRAQVECLSMPPPAVMDPTKDLCPEKSRDPEMD
uniref:Apolipoprotein M n=1 Tax=Oryzias melastigma TaxID=30732 RepID=A0A3B3CEK4_ORYME